MNFTIQYCELQWMFDDKCEVIVVKFHNTKNKRVFRRNLHPNLYILSNEP